MPKIKEIVRIDSPEVSHVARKTSRQPSKKRKRASSEDVDDDEYDWEEKGEVEARVNGFDESEPATMKRIIAFSGSAIHPTHPKNSAIKFARVFVEGPPDAPWLGTGVIELPPGVEKQTKPSKQNSMVFFVAEGAVEATVNKTVVRLKRGGQFLVPRGNNYRIVNLADRTSKLWFVQATDTMVRD